jgi:hypothetical protein
METANPQNRVGRYYLTGALKKTLEQRERFSISGETGLRKAHPEISRNK